MLHFHVGTPPSFCGGRWKIETELAPVSVSGGKRGPKIKQALVAS